MNITREGRLGPSRELDLRDELWPFVEAMEGKLRKNDHKTDWHKLPLDALLRKLEIEVEELKLAVMYESKAEAMNEAVDVANFAFILYDRINMMPDASGYTLLGEKLC